MSVDTVVTTHITANGGYVAVYVFRTGEGNYTDSGEAFFDGFDTNIISVPEAQGGTEEYNVGIVLHSAQDPTKSPVVHSISVQIPEEPGATVNILQGSEWNESPLFYNDGTKWKRAKDIQEI